MGQNGTNGVNGHHHPVETRPLMCRGVRGAISVTENSVGILTNGRNLLGLATDSQVKVHLWK